MASSSSPIENDDEFDFVPMYDSNGFLLYPHMVVSSVPGGSKTNPKPLLFSPDQPPIPPPHKVPDPIGLSLPYLHKFWFEDFDHVDNAYFYPDNESTRFIAQFWKPNPKPRPLVERFLKQVRRSAGYDVDCIPPPMFKSPYSPIDLKTCSLEFKLSMVIEPIVFAIGRINTETGCIYRLLDAERGVKRAVMTPTNYVYLTFVAADDEVGEHTFRALVRSSPFMAEKELVEWEIVG